MMQKRILQQFGGALLAAFVVFLAPKPAAAHPHVFIHGSVDFLMDEQGILRSLAITWRYDAFETLYVLSSIGIVPDLDGSLSPKQRETLIRKESTWPQGFDGASHPK